MIKKLVLLFFFILPAFAFSQKEKPELIPDEDEDYYDLLETGEINISLDISIDAVKRKGQKTLNESMLNTSEYYLPYLSFSVGLAERFTLGADIAYRISNTDAEISLPKINKNIKGNKQISGLDIITLWGSLGVIKEHKFRPSVVLNSYFYIPKTGRAEFQIENLGFFPELSFHNTFGDYFDLTYSGGVSWDGDYEYPSYSFVVTPGFIVSDDFYIYAEFWNSFSNYSSPDNYFTFNLSYENSESFLIDIYAGSTFQNAGKNISGGITFNYYFYAF